MPDIFRQCIKLPVFNVASDMIFVFVSNTYKCMLRHCVYFTSLEIACFNAVHVMFAIASNE